MKRRLIRLNAVQTLTLGFATLIFVGACLLHLPMATKLQGGMPFLDALFTATSASCVTGLALYDTFTTFTIFGQVVLLCLIQIGGLGFMTISIMVAFFLGRRIGLHERSILMDSIGALNLRGVVRLTHSALVCTGVIEALGAVALAFWFVPRFGWLQGGWLSVFHSISAYCNAGFDLMGIVQPGSSLTTMVDQVLPNVVIMFLIIAGGLGFLVWSDLVENRHHWRKYCLHTKIVLATTGILLVLGTVLFYVFEADHAFAGYSVEQRWLMAVFQSVTPRTAGFNTADLTALSPSGMLLTLILMAIGAGSGSTGGGIKVNTVAVLVLATIAHARRKRDVGVFHRRLSQETVGKAYTTVVMFALMGLLGCFVLTMQGYSLGAAAFESISAIGTVGLTLGITSGLPFVSKITILLLMFLGRVGSMSVAMAVSDDKPQPKIRNIKENILIG